MADEAKLKMEDYELTTSWMRQGIERGIQIGEARDRRMVAMRITTRQLRHRFGAALVGQEQMLENLSLAQLRDLAEALLDFQDTGDLVEWLARQN